MAIPKGREEFVTSSEARRLTRRRLLTRLGWGSFALALGGFATSVLSYVLPDLVYEPSPVFTVGRPEDFRVGDMKLIEAYAVFVFRTPRGFQAVSDICTHLGCAYKPYGPPTEEFPLVHARCPCHGSVFARDGRVLAGPAPRPVPFFHLALTANGRLQVDKSVYQPTGELSRASGEGIGHHLYLDPESGELVEGPLPDGSDCRPCRG